jgi:hypothetical protein
MKRVAPALAALLLTMGLLAACGSSDEPATEVNEGADGTRGLRINDGEGNRVSVQGGDAAVAALPDGFTAYPGAQVVSSTAIDTGDGGGGVILMMTTSDPVDQVIEFYRTQALAAGVRLDGQITTGSNTLIGGEGEGGMAFSASAAAGPEGTMVQLTVGRD